MSSEYIKKNDLETTQKIDKKSLNPCLFFKIFIENFKSDLFYFSKNHFSYVLININITRLLISGTKVGLIVVDILVMIEFFLSCCKCAV